MPSAASTSAFSAAKPICRTRPFRPGGLLGELIGGVYPEKAKLLGQRTGELHLALASDPDDRAFAPGSHSMRSHSARSFNQCARLCGKIFDLLKKAAELARELFARKQRRFSAAEDQILAQEQRILDQCVGRDEDPDPRRLSSRARRSTPEKILSFSTSKANRRVPLSERKLKRSALRDVAGMMRSFQYAAYSALWQPAMRGEDVPFLEHWADTLVSANEQRLPPELSGPRRAGASFIPKEEDDLQVLLEAYLLDKAVYEIGYELNNRPDWVVIPIRGIKHILRKS